MASQNKKTIFGRTTTNADKKAPSRARGPRLPSGAGAQPFLQIIRDLQKTLKNVRSEAKKKK